MEWEKQRVDDLAASIGFAGLVGLIRLILERNYPLDLFPADSTMIGARFTSKLHEALAILDEPEQA